MCIRDSSRRLRSQRRRVGAVLAFYDAPQSTMSGARRSPDRPLNTNRGVSERFFPDILADEAQATLPNKRQRRPRNTMGEEVAGDLIFIRMKPPADEAIAGPSQPAADRSRRRNEVARSRPPVSRVRRDSMSVKGLRRVSSLRDGAPAYLSLIHI